MPSAVAQPTFGDRGPNTNQEEEPELCSEMHSRGQSLSQGTAPVTPPGSLPAPLPVEPATLLPAG